VAGLRLAAGRGAEPVRDERRRPAGSPGGTSRPGTGRWGGS
jgi:hypothetical protein